MVVTKVARKSMIIRPSGRSTDFISPSFGHGCLYNCTYCYMKRHKPEGLILQPNVIYLASTVEYTETLRHVPVIQGKSSLGRLGLFVHVTAGFGDVGFKGHWTLELIAVQRIKIYPGMKIAQIVYVTIQHQIT